MVFLRTRAPAFFLLVAACGGGTDSPSAPTPGVAHVTVVGATTSISVGQTLTLTATATDAQGIAVAGVSLVWGSSAPAVAAVSNGGLVTGVAPGTAIISATAGSVAGQLTVTVVTGNQTANCAGISPLSLNVGDVHRLNSAERGVLCTSGGTAGAEYALVAFNTDTSSATVNLVLAASNTSNVAGPPAQRLPLVPTAIGQQTPVRRDATFERHLRATERAELRARFAGARAARGAIERARPSRAIAPGRAISGITGVPATPAIGSLIRLNTNATSACSNPVYHFARVVAVTNAAIVAVDTGAPPNGFTDADYQSFAVTYDTLIYPLDTLNFGSPSDFDGNGRSLLFFTQTVNQLSPPGSAGYVGGFFFGRDLFPIVGNAELEACAGSNEGEMFYLPVVDAANKYNGFFSNRSTLLQGLLPTMAHELEHLISASRRVYINTTATDFEEVWLDEAAALVAQELLYYKIAGLAPKQNLNLSAVRATPAILAATNAYAIPGISDVIEYMRSPDTNSPYEPNDEIPTAGAGWTFLRYALDHGTASPAVYTRALDNGVVEGFANLANVFAGVFTSPTAGFEQWAIAQYLDDTGVSADPTYAMPSWNFRDIMTNGLTNGVFPLKITQLVPASSVNLTMRGGAAAYMRFRVAAAATGQVLPPTGTTPASISLFLVRTR